MNYLNNGAVLPHGLLGEDTAGMLAGFKKSYENHAMRVGVIVKTYPVSDDSNHSKLATEYDVMVIEQDGDRATTTIMYKNCLSVDGLGSVADFFERTMRQKKKSTKKGQAQDTKGQNGAVVLLLCLDGMSDKGIIMGALTHPDRKTTLTTDEPRLEGEYNGINIKIETDGSTTLTFKGATDNDGKVIDKEQGNTVLAIEKDGTFQMKHKGVTARMEKKGKASLTAEDDISNTTKKNFNVTATESVNVKATKDVNMDCVKLAIQASGSALLECQKLEVNSQSEIKMKGSQFQVEAEALAKIKATSITLDGLVSLGGEGGQPVLLLSTQFIGIGNLGAPVISNAIAGYAVKVMAQ